MATSCKRVQEVIVTRHVERPRRVVANHHHHHHHHHVHHTVKREVIHYSSGAEGKRFINRRAELLQYSQHLRQSARLPALTSPLQLPNSSNNQLPETRAIQVQRESKDGRTPACLGNCKATIPNFFKFLSPQARKERNKKNKSLTTSNRKKAIERSLKVQKQHGIFSKLFPTSRKDR